MEAFETFEHAGITCELHYDEMAENPYRWQENLGALLVGPSLARNYDFGANLPEPRDEPTSAVMARYLTLCEGYALAIPWTFADYGSGGARAWLTEPDDEPADGFLVVRDTEGMSLEQCEQTARAEFSEFSSWLEYGACGFVVAPDADDCESVWGFYDADFCRNEAKLVAEDIAHERLVNQEPVDVAEILAGVR